MTVMFSKFVYVTARPTWGIWHPIRTHGAYLCYKNPRPFVPASIIFRWTLAQNIWKI